MFGDVVASLPLATSGKVRSLAVSSSPRRASSRHPDGGGGRSLPCSEGVGWVMIVAPAHTSRPIVDRLYTELKSIAAMPEIQKQMIAPPARSRSSFCARYAAGIHRFRDRALAQGGDARRHRRHAIAATIIARE